MEINANLKAVLAPGPKGTGVSDSSYDTFVAAVSKLKVVAATINYGINKIPTAHVQVEPTGGDNNSTRGLGILCDFDLCRRQPVILNVYTSQGCLQFDGVIDGESISQQPGHFATSFVIKHVFTFLSEVYPRILGAGAGTSNMFALPQGIQIDPNFDLLENNTVSSLQNQFGFYLGDSQVFNLPLDMNQPAIPFLISLCKTLVEVQQKFNALVPKGRIYDNATNFSSFTDVMKAVSVNAQKMAPTVLSLLEKIDASTFTEGFAVKGTDPVVGAQMIDHIALLEDNMFSSLIRILDEYGCVMVIGNKSAYIIPNTPYLKCNFDESGINTSGAKAKQPNIAYPADFENFAFNDVGENTIKGVYVIHEPMTINTDWAAGGVGIVNGFYSEDLSIDSKTATKANGNQSGNKNQVFGNIVIRTLPGLAANYMAAGAYNSSKAIRTVINNGSTTNPLMPTVAPAQAVTTDAAYKSMTEAFNANTPVWTKVQSYMNQWAQLEYCKIKYGDRTGSINLPLNLNWVPGAPGTLYTRHPGMFLDFYVTDVTHTISILPTNLGAATTSVSFNGGRTRGSINRGLDSVDLYAYSFDTSQKFCNTFLTDITNAI